MAFLTSGERVVHHFPRLGDNGIQVSLILEALRVNFVDVLRTGRPGGKPTAGSHYFEATDRSIVGGSSGQFGYDGLPCQGRLPDGFGREFLKSRLLLECRWR